MGKIRILIFGINGMLGERLCVLFNDFPQFEVFGSSVEPGTKLPVDYTQTDITESEKVLGLISKIKPDYIVNAAAYTNVDLSESNRDLAWEINVSGLESICKGVKLNNCGLIHFSTDYIFDGLNGPYTETDPPNPISYYGKTKLEGEILIQNYLSDYTIFRINVLYGISHFGRPDFVRWVVSSLNDKKPIRIVKDQINNPTFIDDAVALSEIAIVKKLNGIYNVGGSEFISRLDFTNRIADFFGLDKSLITPIFTSDLNQPAKRPLNSGLKIDKILKELNFVPTSIENSFQKMKDTLNL